MQGCGCQQDEGVTPWNHRPNAPARVGSGSPVSEDQGAQRDGGVTAGCREVTDTWAMGDTGGLARGWEGRWEVETLCHKDMGTAGHGPRPQSSVEGSAAPHREDRRCSGGWQHQPAHPGPHTSATTGSHHPHASPRADLWLFGLKVGQITEIRQSGGAARSRTDQRAQQGTSSHCDRNKGTLTFNLFLQHCQVISYFRFQLIDFKNPGKKTLMY